MFYPSRPIIERRRGVSEVMGALLLIVVVIVVVATLASFISIAEKNAQNRQTYLTNVADENLQIVNAEFQANSTSRGTFLNNALYWNNVTLTIRNLNTQPSSLTEIKIGGQWASRWNQISNGVVVLDQSSNEPINYGRGLGFDIPARATESIFVAFNSTYNYVPWTAQGGGFLRSESLPVTLLTQLGNFFTTEYTPPTAVAHVSITSISYQDYNRDVISLDGSQSTASNQTTIVSYTWNVLVPYASSFQTPDSTKPANPLGCVPSAFSESTQKDSLSPPVYTASAIGKTTQFLQEAGLPTNATTSLADYCLAGPFEVSLSVTDSLGFIGTSNPIVVANDPLMAPVSSFSASTCGVSPANVCGNIANIFGSSLFANTAVIITYAGHTDTIVVPAGSNAYSDPAATCSGTFEVTVNTLPSQFVTC